MFLFTVLLAALYLLQIQVVASDATALGSSPSPPISPPTILTSSSPTSTIYSCFFTNDNEEGLQSAKESCCRGVVEVWQAGDNDNGKEGHTLSSIELQQRCLLEMAQVPPSIFTTTKSFDGHDIAKFTWVVSRTSASTIPSTSAQQYLWTATDSGDKDRFRRDAVKTVTPYHNTRIPTPMQNVSQSIPIVASKLHSHLGPEGGMHRLFFHSFQPVENPNGGEEDPTYFMYLTIPTGMFIDLDDPIEATMGTIQSVSTENAEGLASDSSQSFVVTRTKAASNTREASVVRSFRARLHAATVCDIEQPSFVSGQHLLVWEIDRIVTDSPAVPPAAAAVIEFATKLHLRYPHPSPTLEEWIDLPSPLLFAARHWESKARQDKEDCDWGMDGAERVWVAAGKDEHHNWVMGMTISCCLIGVGIMLRDISRVSLWDDV